MNRQNKLIKEFIHDPYFKKEGYADPSVCRRCGVVHHGSTFEWQEKPPKGAEQMTCPACKRIEDNYEGGHIILEGSFLKDHRTDILNIIKNTEASQKKRRPLERVITTEEREGRLEVRTTYEHIARRIGEAVHKAYRGELKMHYPEGEKYIRVHWRREG
jgi:hypothetical protein